jgi:hypothetical protein
MATVRAAPVVQVRWGTAISDARRGDSRGSIRSGRAVISSGIDLVPRAAQPVYRQCSGPRDVARSAGHQRSRPCHLRGCRNCS